MPANVSIVMIAALVLFIVSVVMAILNPPTIRMPELWAVWSIAVVVIFNKWIV